MDSLQSALNQSKTNKDLFNLFRESSKITVKRTFFGGREVVIENYTGSSSFNNIMNRFYDINRDSRKSYADYDNEQKINVLKDRISALDFKNKLHEFQGEKPKYNFPKGLFGLICKISHSIREILIADDNSIIEESILNHCNPLEFSFEQFKQIFDIDVDSKREEDEDYFFDVLKSQNDISKNNSAVLEREKLENRITELEKNK